MREWAWLCLLGGGGWGTNKSHPGVVAIKRMRMFCISKNQCIKFSSSSYKKKNRRGDDRGRAKIVVKCLFIFYVHSLLPLLFVITSASLFFLPSPIEYSVALKASALKMTIGHQNGN